ncbi:MAG TPA: hypothetical protein VGT41_05965 [Candidatus Babeliales bacterium]|nr:hypothetical protein [Candidatus Babeliales bacterium]
MRDELIKYKLLVYERNIQYDMFSRPLHALWTLFRKEFPEEYGRYLTNFPKNNGVDWHPLLNIPASTCTQEGENGCLSQQKQQFLKAYQEKYCYGDDATISPLWNVDHCHPNCLAQIKKD